MSSVLLALLSNTGDVRTASDVPQRDVLFHTGGETAFLGGGERGTGGGNALVEAVFVDFLYMGKTPLLELNLGVYIYIYIGYRLGIGMGAYSDQMTGVVHGGFLLQLLHDGGLDFVDAAGRAGGGARTEDGHCDVLIEREDMV